MRTTQRPDYHRFSLMQFLPPLIALLCLLLYTGWSGAQALTADTPAIPASTTPSLNTNQNMDVLIERGRYLTTAANCSGCHTQYPAMSFAGGTGVITPLGTFYPSNITPDLQTGIGSWSDQAFYLALHQGIGQSGENLYPAMPFDSYTLITPEDVNAIKAYLFSLPAIAQQNTAHDLTFPYNKRWLIAGWKILNLHAGVFKPNPAKSEEINRGAYLANALAHCNTCHTPRTITMAMDANRAFSGTTIVNGWFAPNITSDEFSGIGLWTDEQLTQFLRTGHASSKATAGGPMANAVENSLSKLSQSDTQDIIAWLRDQTPIRNKGERVADEARSHFAWGQRQDFSASLRQVSGTPPSADAQPLTPDEMGKQLYYGACASCHGIDGAGVPEADFPAMVGNTTLGRSNPNNVILAILYGVDRQVGQQHAFMPAFGDQLSNAQITALINWLFTHYGRPATLTTQTEVANIRSGKPVGEAPITAIIKAVGVAIISLGIIFVLGWVIRLSPRIKALFSQLKRKREKPKKAQPSPNTID